jgi:selenocysteine-specific elongation factor
VSAAPPVRLSLLDSDRLLPGQSGYARLHLRDPLPLMRGDRFVLRDAGRVLTFGGGEVLDPLPSLRTRKKEHLVLLEGLTGATPQQALAAIVEQQGAVPAPEALLRSGADGPAGVVVLGTMFVSQGWLAEMRLTVVQALARYHESRPLELGMPREQLRAMTRLDAGTFDAFIAQLDDVSSEGAVVRSTDHSVRLAPTQQRERDRLIDLLESSRFTPPATSDLGADAALLQALVDSGELVRIEDFYLTRRLAAEARATVRAAIGERGPLTVAQIRDLLGTTRKYAVPLCEWLDATGATRRRGDERVLGPRP